MDTPLKQRLIGAVVLVALAVIFLPMLVQGPAPDSGVADVSMRVPDAPAGEYETRELPLLAPPSGPAGQGGALPAPAPAAESAADEAEAPTTEPERTDPGTAAGQWAVSFGAYASASDAEAVLSRLRQSGLQGFSEAAELNGRQAWRVRVGPYPDRALAEAGRLQAIRIRGDVNAQVIALDAGEGASTPAAASPAPAVPVPGRSTVAASTAVVPVDTPPRPAAASTAAQTTTAAPARPAPAPASTATSNPAASSIGFAVQMGAFAGTADTEAMRERLRAGGFSTIVQPVRTDKGVLNRVRVGPVSSRAEAEQLKARLAAGGFGAGMVVPHP
ncbi:sporulation protein [Pseudoxanthomonas broegbernensis]|uniref:Sporulation protein n=1 Tax=Pseudoxanthomonas broegbernensis TaxID=83619 RepID=A0A7V8K674_9GAMM|nr:SPOR domain-containing protein [Pseudoxanthomonas broegbernensis]KAF1685461.1 sporulation protein [Pseudoxanthomonas broegbernensis]MBB6064408.1 cell division septation protein DedD [Pseudoxanthomonas broegbernensis]